MNKLNEFCSKCYAIGGGGGGGVVKTGQNLNLK